MATLKPIWQPFIATFSYLLYGNHRNGATSTSWSMGRTRGAPLYLLKCYAATTLAPSFPSFHRRSSPFLCFSCPALQAHLVQARPDDIAPRSGSTSTPPAAVPAALSRCLPSIVMHRIVQNKVVCSLRCAASLQPSPRPASLVKRSSSRPRAPSAANNPRTRASGSARARPLQVPVLCKVAPSRRQLCFVSALPRLRAPPTTPGAPKRRQDHHH
jgi:hypothetical protein